MKQIGNVHPRDEIQLVIQGFKKNAKLLIIGLDNAGKSTLLTKLSTGRVIQHGPTPRGFAQEMDVGPIRFTTYDLGGHPQIRRLWRDYYVAVDGIIFMVDAADYARFEEAKEELHSTIRDDLMPDVPIAVLFNKIDRKEAEGEYSLTDRLDLGVHKTGKNHTPKADLPSRPLETFPCSVVKQVGYGDALRWLAYYVQ